MDLCSVQFSLRSFNQKRCFNSFLCVIVAMVALLVILGVLLFFPRLESWLTSRWTGLHCSDDIYTVNSGAVGPEYSGLNKSEIPKVEPIANLKIKRYYVNWPSACAWMMSAIWNRRCNSPKALRSLVWSNVLKEGIWSPYWSSFRHNILVAVSGWNFYFSLTWSGI